MKIIIIFLLSMNTMFGQKDTLINGILFNNGLTYTDSIQNELFKIDFPKKNKPIDPKKNVKDIDLFELFDPDSVLNSKICFKFAPLSLLGIYTGPSIRFGVEYKIKNNLSFYNEFGYFLNNRGVISKFELKHYFNNQDKNVGFYISGEFSYKYQSYITEDSIRMKPTYNKEYSVSKSVECLTVKFGNFKVKKFGIIVDSFIGGGIRIKQATNTLTSIENENIKSSSDYGPNIFVNESGFKVYPNFDIGIKIGYRLK